MDAEHAGKMVSMTKANNHETIFMGEGSCPRTLPTMTIDAEHAGRLVSKKKPNNNEQFSFEKHRVQEGDQERPLTESMLEDGVDEESQQSRNNCHWKKFVSKMTANSDRGRRACWENGADEESQQQRTIFI